MTGLLKFITCGSVDDGKSTLIGHILYDAKLLFADQEAALKLDSKVGSRGGDIDYSLLLDGLMAEREQGITIDVAYRYFTTQRRSFIVADTPGHEEYTRNMAVGASFAQLSVILVDAAQGVLMQTRRHGYICKLMGIRHFVFAVNKMDLVGYSQEEFRSIEGQIRQLCGELEIEQAQIIPLSATEGDNVTTRSAHMDWYSGPTLLEFLETVDVDDQQQEEGFYLPIQRVSRPDGSFRGFQGEIEAGEIAVGDALTALPSGESARVKGIYAAGAPVRNACAGQAVSLQLDREVDLSRGCVLVRDTRPALTDSLQVTLLWMDDKPLTGGGDFFIKLGGAGLVPGVISQVEYVLNVNSGERREADTLEKNEIALCRLSLSRPVVADVFSRHKVLGELLLIDRLTNATSACGVVEQTLAPGGREPTEVTPQVRAAQKGQKPYVVLTGSAEQAVQLEKKLLLYGRHTMTLSVPDRPVESAALLCDAGLITLLPKPSLTDAEGAALRERIDPALLLDLTAAPELEDALLR